MIRTWIDSPDDPRIADYRDMRASARLRGLGLFVAESRQIVRGLIRKPSGGPARLRIRSLLLNEAAERGLAEELAALDETVDVFVMPANELSGLAGFPVHQGCLALAERPEGRGCKELITEVALGGGLLVVLEAVGDPDNVGAVFRNAEGFGASGILMAGGGDPLYRKAIRVSMGASLRVPFAEASNWPDELAQLRAAGFVVFAAVVGDRNAEDAAQIRKQGELPALRALLLGAEGGGLSADAIRACERRVTVRTAADFDSLNVATASGILLHQLAAWG